MNVAVALDDEVRHEVYASEGGPATKRIVVGYGAFGYSC
jgi:hypothetical protein